MREEERPPSARGFAVWDPATRLVHWAMVLLIAILWWSGKSGELEWHRRAAYGLLVLLVFRLLWGFAGSQTARFRHFVRGPRAVAAYVRRGLSSRALAGAANGMAAAPGHNPLGGWSAVSMLLIMAVQAGLGLIAVDIDGIESGPHSYLVDFDTGRAAAEWHAIFFNVVLAAIALHVTAVFFYLLIRKDNLILPMITGRHRRANGDSELLFVRPRRAAFLFSLSASSICGAVIFAGR